MKIILVAILFLLSLVDCQVYFKIDQNINKKIKVEHSQFKHHEQRLNKRKRKSDGGIETCLKCEEYGHKMLRVFDNVLTCGDPY